MTTERMRCKCSNGEYTEHWRIPVIGGIVYLICKLCRLVLRMEDRG